MRSRKSRRTLMQSCRQTVAQGVGRLSGFSMVFDGLERQLKEFRISRGLKQIDAETYMMTKEHIGTELLRVQKEIDNELPKISNLEKLLSQAMKKLQNLSKIWGSSEYEEKRLLQKTLFPVGVRYNAENHQYLTYGTNRFLALSASI